MIPDTWSICRLMDAYAEAKSAVSAFSKEEDAVEELYACAMRAMFKDGIGDVFTVDSFIDDVKATCFTNYDGSGYFMTMDGERKECISCDVEWLESHRKDYPFIIWYNK